MDYIEEIEKRMSPISEITVGAEIRKGVTSENVTDELRAEILAFAFIPACDAERSPWGLYFAPLSSWISKEGKTVYQPDIAQVDDKITAIWAARATATPHPILAARYNDLLWELSSVGNTHKKHQRYAIAATQSYTIAVTKHLYESEDEAWKYLDRALELALLTRNDAQVKEVITASFVLFAEVNKAERCMWWRLPEILWPHRKLLSDDEVIKILAVLEDAVTKLTTRDGSGFDPINALGAAETLARCYQDLKQPEKATAIILLAGESLAQMSEQADGLLASAWLEMVFNKYHEHHLTEHADRIANRLRERGQDAIKQMKRIESQIEIPQHEVDEMKRQLLKEDLGTTLRGLVLSFIHTDEEMAKMMQEEAKVAPISSMIPTKKFHDLGHVVAEIKGIDDDFAGRLRMFRSKWLSIQVFFLDMGYFHCFEKFPVTGEHLTEICMRSGGKIDNRHGDLISEGMVAWCAGDWVKCLHVLIPVIESIIRDIFIRLGGNPHERNHVGGFNLKTMGSLLRSKTMRDNFPSALISHFETLFTDARGFNLRNELCHGVMSFDRMNKPNANYVVHALMVLAFFKIEGRSANPV